MNSAPPLTHHEIVRIAAPLTQLGLKINLDMSERAARYIEFIPQSGYDASVTVIYTLNVEEDNTVLCRVVAHDSGLISTVSSNTNDLTTAYNTIENVPLTRQLAIGEGYVLAHSYAVASGANNDEHTMTLRSRFACAHVAVLELRIDTSTGGGMPADVRIITKGKASAFLKDTLADGGDLPLNHRAAKDLRRKALDNHPSVAKPELPDDILAILGAQWRPLRFQGDHWKGVLRQLEKPAKRNERIEHFLEQAVLHLQRTMQTSPDQYQLLHARKRWMVYFRRLQPLMVLLGILALMPVSWFFVSSGAMTVHPLALGLTPLLMVGVVVLTAREIPVMEIPPPPSPLAVTAWEATENTG